ncbi:MAG: divergent PAP2 family protein [Clostridia bacterium]|nr:divergent PAP2 family protein [Clostridia bacterium]
MQVVKEFFTNYIVMSALTGWFTAQILKVFTRGFKQKKFDIPNILFGTGGMPSSHTAAVMSMAVATAIVFSPASFEFAIAGVLSMIVMRDAMGVRREVSKQAAIINKLVIDVINAESEENREKRLKELVGHTPLQVWAGCALGIVVPLVLQFIPFFRESILFMRGA